MTGRFQPPRTVTSTRGSRGVSPRSSRSIRSCACTERTRTSTPAHAVPATTLERVPPCSTPTLTVVPPAGSAAPGPRPPRRAGGRVQPQHQPGDLVDGAGPGLRIEAGVRLDATHLHVEEADPL